MADRPKDTPETRHDPTVPHETKPHPDRGRPSTTTGESTRATDSHTGLGSDKPQKSSALRMVLLAALAIIIVVLIAGLFA